MKQLSEVSSTQSYLMKKNDLIVYCIRLSTTLSRTPEALPIHKI